MQPLRRDECPRAMHTAITLLRDDSTARFDLGEAQLALGQVSKGEQNISAAAEKVSPQAKTVAELRIKGLREAERRLDLLCRITMKLARKMASMATTVSSMEKGTGSK